MDDKNRPTESDPGSSDADEVSGYKYDPVGVPVKEGPQPVPPGITPPPVPGPDPVEYDPSATSLSKDNPDFHGGPESAVQGYMLPVVPVPPGVDDRVTKKSDSDQANPSKTDSDPTVPPGIKEATH